MAAGATTAARSQRSRRGASTAAAASPITSQTAPHSPAMPSAFPAASVCGPWARVRVVRSKRRSSSWSLGSTARSIGRTVTQTARSGNVGHRFAGSGGVDVRAAVACVRLCTTVEVVVAGAAEQGVVVERAAQLIVAVLGPQRIVARAPEHVVASRARAHAVVPVAAGEAVVASEQRYHVVAGGADQRVGAGRTDDRRADACAHGPGAGPRQGHR